VHFLERYSGKFSAITSSSLPKNITKLNIERAIKAIRQILGRLILTLGIDEYQVIRRLPRRTNEQSPLATLLDVLVELMMDPKNVIIPLLTGTVFDSCPGSSGSVCNYVPLKLLSMKEVVILGCNGDELLTHEPAYRHLFTLGGVSRYFVKYAKAVQANQVQGVRPSLPPCSNQGYLRAFALHLRIRVFTESLRSCTLDHPFQFQTRAADHTRGSCSFWV
jgi:hypothetical protein